MDITPTLVSLTSAGLDNMPVNLNSRSKGRPGLERDFVCRKVSFGSSDEVSAILGISSLLYHEL
jgi:hypothetical protein